MADDESVNMYDTDDLETLVQKQDDNKLGAVTRGMVTELDINGKKFDLVNPDYVKEMQRVMLDMSNKMRVMDRNIQSMSTAMRQQARTINNLTAQLGGKIDRD